MAKKSFRQTRKEAIEREQAAKRAQDQSLSEQNPNIAREEKRSSRGGEGDPLNYVPFNIDNLPRNKRTRAIFADYGIPNWRAMFADWDIVHTEDAARGGNFRYNAYNTPDELVRHFSSTGILPYVKILYNPHTGLYHAYVGSSN